MVVLRARAFSVPKQLVPTPWMVGHRGGSFIPSPLPLYRETLLSFRGVSEPLLPCATLFSTKGYNYRLTYLRSRRLLLLRLGYSYYILIRLPDSLHLSLRKRNFALFGFNKVVFDRTVHYIRNLRTLYPYKLKGFSFFAENLPLKEGKKSKFR